MANLEECCDNPVTAAVLSCRVRKLVAGHIDAVDLPNAPDRARRNSKEIKEAGGSVVFHVVACWDDKDRRLALAQITRLAQSPSELLREVCA